MSLKIVTFTDSYLGNRPTSTGQDGKERWKKPKVLYSRGLIFHWLAVSDVTSIRPTYWLLGLNVTVCRRFWLVSGEAARAPLAPLFLAGISFTSERQTSDFWAIWEIRHFGIIWLSYAMKLSHGIFHLSVDFSSSLLLFRWTQGLKIWIHYDYLQSTIAYRWANL